MASSPREGPSGRRLSRLRRTASRPRLPQLRRSLAAPVARRLGLRRTPLAAPPGRYLAHGPLDVPALAVRRPWWITARRHALLHDHRAGQYVGESGAASVSAVPGRPSPLADLVAAQAATVPSIIDPAGTRRAPLGSRVGGRVPVGVAAQASVPIASHPRMSMAAAPAAWTAAQGQPAMSSAFTVPAAAPGALAAALLARRSAPLTLPTEPDPAGPATLVHRIDGSAPRQPRAAAASGSPAGDGYRPGAPMPPITAAHQHGPGGPGRRPPRPETIGAGEVHDLRVVGGVPVAAPAGGFDAGAALSEMPRAGVSASRWAASMRAPGAALRRTFGSAGGDATGSPYGDASGHAAGAEPVAASRTGRAASVPPMSVSAVMARRRATALGPESAPQAQPDPEARWRAAVATRPLESPLPFPTGLRPLVAALTGAERASYTTGPATRHALAAAGAHGATTGSVVHLPAAPTPAPGPLLGVVAHELAHARYPVSRPRFLLGIPDGAADAEERAAQAVGRRFQSAASGGGEAIRAGIVDELPVGGMGRLVGSGGAGGALAGRLPSAGGSALDDLASGDPTGGALAAAGGAVDGGLASMSGALPQWPGAGMPGADLAGGGMAGAAMGAVMTATSGGSEPAPGGAAQPSNVDIDRLADLLEQRLLRQIERRGGRYAGVF